MRILKIGALLSLIAGAYFTPACVHAEDADFKLFLDGLAQEVEQKGIDTNLFYRSFEGELSPYKRALELITKQPESKFNFAKYAGSMLSNSRIDTGRERFDTHLADLKRIGTEHGVDPQVIVALWGVETFYGKWPGKHNIIRSLATLAYDSHRKAFFRKELMNAMQILHEGHISPEQMKGSWAGAMGQCQFMPSSFMNYAADGDGDGHKDIWENPKDVFASTANYLKRSGWQENTPWGERILLTKILPPLKVSDRGLSEEQTIAEWKKAGVKAVKGSLPADGTKARLFMPEGPSKKASLVYINFDVILRWNRSSYFAYSVLSLADAIAEGKDS